MHANSASIGWFEIAGTDPAKTEAFYAKLFGWSFVDGPSGPDYRMATATGPIAGGITQAPAGTPEHYAIFSVTVADVEATCQRLVELGGKVLVGPQAVGDTGLIFANVEDPDGNHFGLIRPPKGPRANTPTIVHEDQWGALIDHPDADMLENRWYDASAALTTEGFNERCKLIVGAFEQSGRSSMLVDAVQFLMDANNLDAAWRDANIIPRFNAAGMKKQALIMPTGFPRIGAPPAPEGPSDFPTAFFATRADALAWLAS